MAMLMIISPAKALNFAAAPANAPLTIPMMGEHTQALAKVARRLTVADLKRLMAISDDLAKLNRGRFQAFDPESEDGLQAVLAFNGDVYRGLDARSLDRAALAWTQDHLRILSGLYGLLRPLDAIQPYRLEMGSRLKTRRGPNLYAFWGDRLAEALNDAGRGLADPTVVNLASQEYFGAVDRAALRLPLVHCHFREERDGALRTLSFFAKRARGLMARFVIERRLEKPHDLKAFDVEGYAFDAALSTATDFVFIRTTA